MEYSNLLHEDMMNAMGGVHKIVEVISSMLTAPILRITTKNTLSTFVDDFYIASEIFRARKALIK